MTDDRKATPGSKQHAEEPAEVRKPPIIAGSDVDVAGIGGKATRPAREPKD